MSKFTTPTKATVANPRSQGYDASIGDVYVRLFPTGDDPILIGTVTRGESESLVQTAVNAEDFGEVEARTFSRTDFTGGEGLDLAHQRGMEDRDLARYWDSRNIDVRSRPGSVQEITLLTQAVSAVSDLNENLSLVTDGESVWWGSGVDVRRSDNIYAASPSSVVEDPHAGQGAVDIEDLTVLGDQVHAALGVSGIHQRTAGGTWSHWSDVAAVRVWSVKGRVLASTGPALYEAATGATSTLLHTLPSGEEWTSVTDAGGVVLAAATDGYIHAFQPTGETLDLTLIASTRIEGETPVSLGAGQGFVFYATTTTNPMLGTVVRWWRAIVDDAGVVRDGQVLRVWGADLDAVERHPTPIRVTRDSAYVVVAETVDEAALWRYDFDTAAVSRDLIYETPNLEAGLVVLRGRAVASFQGDSIWAQSGTYANHGWLISPLADFFTARDKQWVDAILWTAPIAAGMKVRLSISDNPEAILDPAHSSWTPITTLTSGAGGRPVVINDRVARWMTVKLDLYPADNNLAAPKVRGFRLRAYPGWDDVTMELPVNASDHMERPRRKRIHIPGRGHQTFEMLKRMEGTPQLVELLRPQVRVRGIVESVSQPIPMLTPRGSQTLVCNVLVRGRVEQFGSGGAETLAGAFAVGQFALMQFGGVGSDTYAAPAGS